MLSRSETFTRLGSPIYWTEHFVRAFEAASKSQQRPFGQIGSDIRDL